VFIVILVIFENLYCTR